ncbi:MAG: DUF484 family protein [Burkholderiales bacterium]|nr:DUF484 family protein [Burkholderiales bacterium]
MSIQGITETDIAEYLANTPGFFERHAELMSTIQLTSPHGQRAVSLQERQMEMLRERIKGLEMKIVEMIRNSQENLAIADRLHRWTRTLMLTADTFALPGVLIYELRHQFMIPQAALRVWNTDASFAAAPFAAAVSDDVKAFAESMSLPYCGVNAGFEAVSWLEDATSVASVALVPLHHVSGVFGLLALGSPDPTRYAAEMGTEFLQRIGDIAGAALSRLLRPA